MSKSAILMLCLTFIAAASSVPRYENIRDKRSPQYPGMDFVSPSFKFNPDIRGSPDVEDFGGSQGSKRSPSNRGPPDNRGPPKNRGPPNNRGPPDNRGPPPNRGPPANRGPPPNRGPPDNRIPPGNQVPLNDYQQEDKKPVDNRDQPVAVKPNENSAGDSPSFQPPAFYGETTSEKVTEPKATSTQVPTATLTNPNILTDDRFSIVKPILNVDPNMMFQAIAVTPAE